MPTVNSREYQQIFSLNRQSDIETPIATNKVVKQRSLRTFRPVVPEQTNITDRAWYGKGHSHATFVDTIMERYRIDAQERSATDLELLYALLLVMGQVTTVAPDSVTNPNHWRHTFRWQDPAQNKQVIYTTLYEIMGTEFTKLISGAWLNSLTLTGNREDHVVLSYEGGARKYATASKSSPGITAARFFKTLFGRVELGLADAPLDISTEVLSFNLTISQNALPLHLMGNPAGEKRSVSEVLIGDQTVAASVVTKVNAQHYNRFLDRENIELWLFLRSAEEVFTGQPYQALFKLHNARISDVAWGEEGQTVALTLNVNEDSAMQLGADEQLTVQVDTSIDGSELGVVG